MLIIGVEVIKEMMEARTEVGPNPSAKVRVCRILDKLFVGIVKNLGTSITIVEIQKKRIE